LCGITGFWKNNSIYLDNVTIINQMNEVLVHRGPDGGGVWYNQQVVLGHRRLSIIDLNTGNQPMISSDKKLVIVFNGEIYNYVALREKCSDYEFKTQSDTEVLLALYKKFNYQMLSMLNGIFAFVIYDIQNNKLFIARDHLGVKPLFYYHNRDEFIFASELKSLRKHPSVPNRLDTYALNLYLTFEHIPAPYTIVEGVKKLESGHYLVWDGQKLEKNKYYEYSFKNKFKEKNINFYIDFLDKELQRSISMQKISDVPIGAFLSGGIDSSLVTALLAKQTQEKLKTFNIGFEEASFDESLYAQKVAEYVGTDHYSEKLSVQRMVEILPQVLKQLDEPFADPSLLPTYLLSQLCKKHVTVALSGDGSDELFAGYPTYYAAKNYGYLPTLLHYLLNPLAQLLPVSEKNISFDFKVKRFVAGLKYTGALRHTTWLGAFSPAVKRKLFSEKLNQLFINKEPISEILNQHLIGCDTEDNWERSLWIDMRFYLQDNMLVKVDRASMMHGLEVRVPFLDPELVAIVCRIPSKYKYYGKISKYILKKLAYRYLPKEIIERPKKGFGIPLSRWIRHDLKTTFQETLSKENIDKRGLFNPDFVSYLLMSHLKRKKDFRKELWTLFILEKWFENNHLNICLH
jgi:asparagine synthase (glutamine-hydrolysing)